MEQEDILQIDLSKQTNKTIKHFFDGLFRYIYKLTNIKFVEYDSKLYFQTSNQWGGGKPTGLDQSEISKLAHKDFKCNGYWDCDCKNKKSKPTPTKEMIKYIYSWRSWILNDIKEYCDDELDPCVFPALKSIDKFIGSNREKQSENIQIILSKPLIINNTSGFNSDHRGSDHIPLTLPYSFHEHMDSTITLKELIDVAYLIKSHKFDYWYELFCGVRSIKNNDFIELNIGFDHGS
jgi:hypothetical protein